MQPQDREMFGQMLAAVYSLYRQELSQGVMEMWWAALRTYDLAAVRTGFNSHASNPDGGRFLPMPADIVKALGGTNKDQSLLACAALMKAVREVGHYRSVAFDDPIIHRCVQDMGGWMEVCKVNEKEAPHFERRFMDLYRAYRTRDAVPEHPAKLVGYIEAVNSFNGYADHPAAIREAEPVLIGNKERAAKVAAGALAPRLPGDVTRLIESRG